MNMSTEIKVKRHFVCPGTTRRIRGLLTRRLATRRVAKQTRGVSKNMVRAYSQHIIIDSPQDMDMDMAFPPSCYTMYIPYTRMYWVGYALDPVGWVQTLATIYSICLIDFYCQALAIARLKGRTAV